MKRRWKVFRRNRSAMIGAAVVLLALVTALFAGALQTHDPEQRLDDFRHPPGAKYLLGTDENGFDIYSRLVHGARASLMAAFGAVACALFIGVPIGLFAGWKGGLVDGAIMRVVDILLAFPSVLLAIAIAAIMGEGSLTTVIIAVAVVMIAPFIRQVRASVLQVKEFEYVTAARAVGARDRRILFRTVLPNCLAPILVLATLNTGIAILDVAGLSFLGLGPPETTPEWGVMLTGAFKYVEQLPWMVLPAGIAISLTVLGFNLLGDGLRDAFDPRQSRS